MKVVFPKYIEALQCKYNTKETNIMGFQQHQLLQSLHLFFCQTRILHIYSEQELSYPWKWDSDPLSA